MTAETNDEEIVTTWHFVIHGEAVPVRVTDVYAMLGHEPREFYSAEVTYRDETYRVDCRPWTDANEPMGPVMWLVRDLIERRVPVTEVLMPGQPTRDELALKIADLEARNADLAKDRDTALASSLALLHARDELRAIVEGRTAPPTDAEIDAHHAAGGSWLTGDTVTWAPASLRGMRDNGETEGCVWIALDRSYRPCARPVVEVSRGA